MRGIVAFLVVVAVAVLMKSGGSSIAAEPELDDLRRQVLTAEDTRFKRTVDLAEMYSKLGRLGEARRLYEEALLLRPDDLDTAEDLLGVLRRLGDDEAQLPLYRRLVSGRPLDPGLQMRMGECLWRLKRADEARRAWDELLARFPTECTVYDDLIDFYVAESRPEDARTLIGRRRERFGEDGELLFAQARLAVAAREPEEAIDVLLRCLDLDLSEEETRRAESMLFSVARETGPARTGELLRRLTSDLETIDGQLADRLLGLAQKAAQRRSFPEAVTLARRALPLLKTPAKHAEVTALITRWQAAAPK